MTKKICFIICPIGSERSPERKRADQLLKYVIEKSLNGLNYKIIRADKISKPGMITSQIIENLIEADIVIADLFNYNPNVFYELGIRHSINKPVIQLYNPDQHIPFDVSGLRSIKLDITDLESVDNCISELNQQIKAVEDNPKDSTSPFSITVDLKALKSSDKSTEIILSRILEEIENLRVESRPIQPIIPKIDIGRHITELEYLNVRKIELKNLRRKVSNELEYLLSKEKTTKKEKNLIASLKGKLEVFTKSLVIINERIVNHSGIINMAIGLSVK